MFEEWQAWNVRRALKNGAIFPCLFAVPAVAMRIAEGSLATPHAWAFAATSLVVSSAICSTFFGSVAWIRNKVFRLR